MGKLLFVNTNRATGIFGMIICAAAIAAGVWFGLGGAYAGLLLVPSGLFAAKFCLKIATMRSELYEQGFVKTSCFGSVTGRYGDLKSISRGAVRTNGVLVTNIHFVNQSGERATISKDSMGKDDKMSQLLGHACESLASTWMKTLDRQKEVVWMVKGTSPILRIRRDGVVFQGKMGADEFVPLNQLQLKSGHAMAVEICRGTEKVAEINSADPNYFVGERLVAMLLENQPRPAAMQSLDPERRAMIARATNSTA
jgi:hypothetical protein